MATLRFRNGKWQVQVRRLGYQARTQSFLNKTDAQRWARQIETELDRTLIPNDVRTLAKVTLAELLIRYRDTVTINRRGRAPESKRIEVFLRQDWCAYPLAKLNARYFSAYRDARLKCVGPGTVIRELGLLRSIFETARREWGYSSLDNPLASIRKPKAPNGRERRLFGTDPARIKLLNQVAPHFFRMIQDGFWELSLLGLTRLTDPAISKVRKEEKSNLTVRALPELIDDPALKAHVEKLIDEVMEATKFARSWRDRRIAHRDLKLALEEPTEPLAEGSRADVKKALRALAAILNAVASHYLDSQTGFEYGSALGGAGSLLYVLEIGAEEQAKELRRLEQSVQTHDEPKPAITLAATDALEERSSHRRTMFLGLTTMLCGFGLWTLTPVIWLYTIYLAYLTSFRAVLAALFFPFLAQLYWIWELWMDTGTILNIFTLLCFAWIALALIGLATRASMETT